MKHGISPKESMKFVGCSSRFPRSLWTYPHDTVTGNLAQWMGAISSLSYMKEEFSCSQSLWAVRGWLSQKSPAATTTVGSMTGNSTRVLMVKCSKHTSRERKIRGCRENLIKAWNLESCLASSKQTATFMGWQSPLCKEHYKIKF